MTSQRLTNQRLTQVLNTIEVSQSLVNHCTGSTRKIGIHSGSICPENRLGRIWLKARIFHWVSLFYSISRSKIGLVEGWFC